MTCRLFTLKNKRRLPGLLVAAAALTARLLRRTYRTRIRDEAGLLAATDLWPVILVVWHNRLLFTADFFPKRMRARTKALASASRDGEYAAAFIERFLGGVVRGSTSRGGLKALRQLKRELSDDHSVVLTVDGPRGPRYRLQIGAALLAARTGIPAVPISLNAPSRWELKGWDRTQIPKPFSSVELVIGAPVHVPPTRGSDALDVQRQRLEDALLAITDDG